MEPKISTELQREVIAELTKNGVTIAAASAPIVISTINRLTDPPGAGQFTQGVNDVIEKRG